MTLSIHCAQFLQTSIKRTPSIKRTLGKVPKVSSYRGFTVEGNNYKLLLYSGFNWEISWIMCLIGVVNQCIGRHVSRLSIDMLVAVLVKCQSSL